MTPSLEALANHELLAETHALVRRGRAVEAELLRHLGEVDARRLYLAEACSSMFVYCVRVLHFSEAAAYRRIRAARAARKHPELLCALRRGDLHVTAVSLLAAQLTLDNCGELIRTATHKTSDEIKRLLADRQPKPDLADLSRRLILQATVRQAVNASIPPVRADQTGAKPALVFDPAVNAASSAAPPATSPATMAPLGRERYRVCFTANEALRAQLQELRALMRHSVPDGDLGKILGRAVACCSTRSASGSSRRSQSRGPLAVRAELQPGRFRPRSGAPSRAGTQAAAAMSLPGARGAVRASSWSSITATPGLEAGRIRSTASRYAAALTTNTLLARISESSTWHAFGNGEGSRPSPTLRRVLSGNRHPRATRKPEAP